MARGAASVTVQELLEPDHGLVRAQFGGRFLASGSAGAQIKAERASYKAD